MVLLNDFRIGPRAADLIHLGAKFSPCMRLDSKINYEIMVSRKGERETACCIRNDDSGCVQAYRNDCSVSDYNFNFQFFYNKRHLLLVNNLKLDLKSIESSFKLFTLLKTLIYFIKKL